MMKSTATLGLSAIAVTGAAVLVLGLVSAPASAQVTGPGTQLAKVTASVPSKITRPTTGAVTKSFTVRFDGPAAGGADSYKLGYPEDSPKLGAVLIAKNAGETGAVSAPVLKYNPNKKLDPASGTSDSSLQVKASTTLGKYRVVVPVTYHTQVPASNTTVSTTKYVSVNADPKVSRAQTTFTGTGKRKRTFTVRVTAPKWETGAKVRVYFKAKGKSKYKRVATRYMKMGTGTYANASRRTIKISKKYNLAGKGGRYFLKFYSTVGAPGYKTASKVIVRR